jgi:hypothetical protein
MVRDEHGPYGARTSLNSIDVSKYAGVTRIYAPRFTTLVGDTTILNVINANHDSDAFVTVTLHANDGSVLGTPVTKFLPRDAQINDDLLNIFQNDLAIRGKQGWIEVSSTADYIVGTVSFTNLTQTYMTSYELSSTPLSRFLFPLAAEDTSVYKTGISLVNNNSQSATVQIDLWGPAGTIDRSTSLTLPPLARIEGFLADFFPGLASRLEGNIRIQSSQPLHSSAIIWDRNLKFACSMPPMAYPE